MESINLWFFYSLGFYLGILRQKVLGEEKLLGGRYETPIEHVRDIFKTFKETDMDILPKSKRATDELLAAVDKFAAIEKTDRPPTIQEWSPLLDAIHRFQTILEQEMGDSYIYCVTPVGAYATDALVQNAETHLSRMAQQIISDEQKLDYRLAGKCLALDLYTASGFHAMRCLEAEVREYHKLVTGVTMDDVPLGSILNGDNRHSGSGLVPAHAAEGGAKDSPLGLIISLLSHVNKIYRCPINHPEMTLTAEKSRQVFNLASVAISAMMEDTIARVKKRKQQAATQPSVTQP
jgi:hypothetical protein